MAVGKSTKCDSGIALYRCITASDDGGIIVGGTMIGNLTFGSTTLIGDFSTDSFIAKLDGNGNWVWATQFDTISENGAVSVTGLDLTPTGDVIATGGHTGTTDFDGTTVTSTDDDVYIAKLSSSTGAIIFVKNAGGIGQEVSTDVKVDSSGNIWQLGYVYDAFTVDGITFDSIGIVDTFLAKYNSLGTATMVTGAKSGSDSDLVASFSLAIDGQDSLYFSGYFSGSVNAQSISLTSSGGNDMHVMKVFNNGAFDWGISGGKASTDDSIEKITVSDISEGSRINLTDTEDQIINKIKKAKTDNDTLPGNEEGLKDRPEAENLMGIYSSLSNQNITNTLNEFEGKNFSDLKNKLSEIILTKLSPISKEIQKLLSDKNYIDQILKDGAAKAQDISSKKVKKLKEIVGF